MNSKWGREYDNFIANEDEDNLFFNPNDRVKFLMDKLDEYEQTITNLERELYMYEHLK